MPKRILYFLILLFIFVFSVSSVFAQDGMVIKNVISDDAGKLILINGTNLNHIESTKLFKLSNPDRAVLDLPDSVLIGNKKSIDITDSAISNVKVSQFSTSPNVVRLVFTASNKESLNQVKFIKSENSVILKLDSVESQKNEITPVYHDRDFDSKTETELSHLDNKSAANLKNVKPCPIPAVDVNEFDLVLNAVKFRNNHLTMSGTGTVALKEPFTLQSPSRVIFDLPNATFSYRNIPLAFTFSNGDAIKIGQFNPYTVRVVVTTSNPDNYKTIISPDLQTLIIAPKDKINISELPNSNISSQIQKIDVRKVNAETTVITLKATSPIIHHVKRLYYPDRFRIELFNVNAPNKNIITSLPKTGQFQGIGINYIEKYPTGSSWTFPVNNNTKVDSSLSFDGKLLELVFTDVPVKQVNSVLSSKGKVVIDAGHGGSEPGAQRENIFEKDITLAVAKKVKNYLNQAGINVVMTRSDDSTVSLKQRTVITNDENPEAFVSIHVNSCNAPTAAGLETHWYTPQSKKLAQVVQKSLISSINSPDRGIMNSMFYVIHHTEVPAVLVEIGFISNDSERNQLLTPERQESTARAIAEGIIEFLKQ